MKNVEAPGRPPRSPPSLKSGPDWSTPNPRNALVHQMYHCHKSLNIICARLLCPVHAQV
jgi:hypothetical protein